MSPTDLEARPTIILQTPILTDETDERTRLLGASGPATQRTSCWPTRSWLPVLQFAFCTLTVVTAFGIFIAGRYAEKEPLCQAALVGCVLCRPICDSVPMLTRPQLLYCLDPLCFIFSLLILSKSCFHSAVCLRFVRSHLRLFTKCLTWN